MDVVAQVEEFGRRLARVAQAAGRSPNDFLAAGTTGQSRAGRVSVTVNTMGYLQNVRIEPGSVLPDDEANLAAAIMEAYADARAKSTAMLAELVNVESTPTPKPTPRQPTPRRARPPQPEDEDESSPSFLHRA